MNVMGSGLTVLAASAAVLVFTGNVVPDSRAMQKREEELSMRTQPLTRTETEELSYFRINRIIRKTCACGSIIGFALTILGLQV